MNRVRRAWTEKENEKIKNLAGRASLREIARQLNRSEAATAVQASKLRVSVKLGSQGPVEAPSSRPAAAIVSTPAELVAAPAAIERALSIYQQLQQHDPSVVAQAKKILTHIYGMVDQGETDEQRLTVGGLARLKAVERDHAIKSAQDVPTKKERREACDSISRW